MRDYPKRIRMTMISEFGELGRVPLGSDKGRVYELVDPPSEPLTRLISNMKKLGLWDHEKGCPVGCTDSQKWGGPPCEYPDCVTDTEDEYECCPRWLLGECTETKENIDEDD